MPVIQGVVPTSFEQTAFAAQWFHWSNIGECFWPGKGGCAASVNPELAPVRELGGVYCFAWSLTPPSIVGPKDASVRYIGETSNFCRRMSQFGTSAGFWGDRANGHSAGWRWPQGQVDYTWVSFFPIGNELAAHLATGMRLWMEAVALEEFRLLHGKLPEINEAVDVVAAFEL